MMADLVGSVFPQKPGERWRDPGQIVSIWVAPSLLSITCDAREQAVMLALAQYVQLRQWNVSWDDYFGSPPTHWEDAAGILLAPILLILLLLFIS
ncbi:MAG TPA: hypothetical protein VLA89_18830 [Gemmatimonadales bacterium]|nr:hypothetical protein [Gemmatimonadales bacterium]